MNSPRLNNHILLFCMVIFDNQPVGANECLPSMYTLPPSGIRIRAPINPALYSTCTNLQTGGGFPDGIISDPDNHCFKTWWYVPNQGCTWNKKDPCTCSAYTCSGGFGEYCFCSMGGGGLNRAHKYCFKETTSCYVLASTCPTGNVIRDCGCFQNGTTLAAGSSEKRWNCYSGFCTACPKGHQCPDKAYAIPCDASKNEYQDEEGQARCKQCICPPRQYRTATFKCDPDIGPVGCGQCDRCTDSPECESSRNPNFWKDNNGYCRMCENAHCTHPNYFRGSPNDMYCYFTNVQNNATVGKCAPLYFDMTLNPNDPGFRTRDFQKHKTESEIKEGYIPWKAGYKRTKPMFPMAHTGGILHGYPGQLPFYTRCESLTPAYPYKWTTNTDRIAELNKMTDSWEHDCSKAYAQDCDNAKPVYFDELTNLLLRTCETCKLPSFFKDNKCICPNGTASLDQLQDRSLVSFPVFPKNTTSDTPCYTCRAYTETNFLWQKGPAIFVSESLRCSEAMDQLLPANQLQYLTEANEWATCGSGLIPNLERTACLQCPQGQYASEKYPTFEDNLKQYECRVCEAGTYQDMPGQFSCKPKRTTCLPGNKVIINDESDVTHDNDCEPCETRCLDGQIQVYQDNSNDTCSGNGLSYFACYDWANNIHFPMDTRLRYTQTPGLNPQPSIRVEKCPEQRLPDHSFFVKVEQQELNGRQCYFSCLHGVDKKFQEIIHEVEERYALVHNVHLTPFIVKNIDNSPKRESGSKIKILSEELQLDHNHADDAEVDFASWIHQTKEVDIKRDCPFCDVAWKSNTFLMIDDLLTTPNSMLLSSLLTETSQGIDNTTQIYYRVCLNHSAAYNRCQNKWYSTLTPNQHYADKSRMQNGLNEMGSYVKCAYDARTSLIAQANRGTDTYSVQSSHATEICRLEIKSRDNINSNASSNVSEWSDALTDTSSLTLTSWDRVGCTEHCLDKEQLKIRNVIRRLDITSNRMPIAQHIEYFLSRETWRNLSQYPYIFSSDAPRCSFDCGSNTIKLRYKDFPGVPQHSTDVSACVPCSPDDTGTLALACSLLGKILKSARCNNQAVTNWTLDDICDSCSQNKEGAVYIETGSDSQISGWTSQREAQQYHPMNSWQTMACKYRCVPGFYPNDVEADYRENPCISCSETIQTLCVENHNNDGSETAWFKQKPNCDYGFPLQYKSVKCNTCQNYWEPHNDNIRGNSAAFKPGIYESESECLALCHESDYHSFDRRTVVTDESWIPITSPIPIQHLTCVNCTEFPDYPCNGSCLQHRFLHPTSNQCTICNDSACPSPELYREECQGGNRNTDAQCIDCPPGYRQNNVYSDTIPYLMESTSDLARLIQSTKNKITRKYVSLKSIDQDLNPVLFVSDKPTLSLTAANKNGIIQRQCLLACQNNYVWIDITTQKSPHAKSGSTILEYDHERHMCLPCDSSFFKQALASQDLTLYSVWNESGNHSLFSSLWINGAATLPLFILTATKINMRGSCYACQDPGSQITTENSSLCATAPGSCSSDSCSPHNGTFHQELSTAIPTNTIASGTFFRPGNGQSRPLSTKIRTNNTNGNRRRRLLQTAFSDSSSGASEETLTKKKLFRQRITAYKLPVQRREDSATCCDYVYANSDEDKEKCKNMQAWEIQFKFLRAGKSLGNDFCSSFRVIDKMPTALTPNVMGQTSMTAGKRTRNLLQFNTEVLNPNTINAANAQNEEVIEFEIQSPRICPAGTYKEGVGYKKQCTPCPNGASTTWPYTGSTSKESCFCQLGWKTTRREWTENNEFILECTECGVGFFRSDDPNLFPSNLNETTYCLPCPDPVTMFTPSRASSRCFCKPGFYRYDAECVPCPVGSYCSEEKQIQCPAFSTTLSSNSSERGHCICNSKTHYGNLSEPDSQCIEIPPGIRCLDGSWDCECASGWTKVQDPFDKKRARCITSCKIGEYIEVNEQDKSISTHCRPCPLNTYSDKPEAIGLSESCRSCPSNTFTERNGSSNISDCKCATPSATIMECGICPENYYMDNNTKICTACPHPLLSNRGSLGRLSCSFCPKGYQSIKKPIINSVDEYNFEYECVPCPAGFFSQRTGISCTACPRGYTTFVIGASSLNQCVPVQTMA